jgi:general secretion pathway protein M
MTQRFLAWFRTRTQREQYLLLAGGAMVVVALCYFLVVPLGDVLDAAKARHADAVIALGETQARVDAVKAAAAGRSTPLDAPLDTLIRSRADDAGFALASVVPQGNDLVQIAIASARPGPLVGWLAELEASGILVDRLATTDNGDRTLSVQLTLKTRGA